MPLSTHPLGVNVTNNSGNVNSSLDACENVHPTRHPDKAAIFACVSITLLLATVTCNSVSISRGCKKRGKFSSGRCLVRFLMVIGILEASMTTLMDNVTIMAGEWLLGDTACQFYGLLYNSLHYAWVWLLAIAAIDRYVKCHLVTEHASLFSPTNTRIMALGSILLLIVLYLAPIYGWGEYSYFRGKVDLQLSVLGPQSPSVRSPSLSQIVYHVLKQPAPHSVQDHMVTSLAHYFYSLGSPTWRTMQFSEAGAVLVPLRFISRSHFDCFRQELLSGSVANVTEQILYHNGTMLGLEGFRVNFVVDLDTMQVEEYTSRALPFQECGTCGLDYTDVNPNVYSFLGMSLAFNILFPVIIMCFCFGSCLLSSSISANPVMPADIILAKVFALAAFLTMLCDIPMLVANIVFASGHRLSHGTMIAVTLIGHCRNLTMVASSAVCRRGVKEVCVTPCCSSPDEPHEAGNSKSSLVSMHTMPRAQSNSSLKKYQTFQETSLVATDVSNGSVTNV